MNLKIARERMRAISSLYGIKLNYLENQEYVNCSYCAGHEIFIGLYDNVELEVVSYFHELGHILDPRKLHLSKFDMESRAWTFGFLLARFWSFTFSEETLKWAEEQLMTYTNDAECHREFIDKEDVCYELEVPKGTLKKGENNNETH